MIDTMILRWRRYTDDKFHKAKEEQQRLRLKNKISEMAEKVQDEISLILLQQVGIK